MNAPFLKPPMDATRRAELVDRVLGWIAHDLDYLDHGEGEVAAVLRGALEKIEGTGNGGRRDA